MEVFGDFTNNQQANETSDTEIGPLYVLETLGIVDCGCEEDAAGKKRRDKGTDTLDGLCQIQSDLAISRRSTDR
jgi:hypothetical protein